MVNNINSTQESLQNRRIKAATAAGSTRSITAATANFTTIFISPFSKNSVCSQLEHSFSNHTILWRPVYTEYYQHLFLYDRRKDGPCYKKKKKKKKKDGAMSELRGTPDETEMLYKA